MDSKTCSCSSLMILFQWIPIPTVILVGVYCLSGCGFQSIFLTSIALIISSTAIFIQSRQTMKKEPVLKSNEEHETLPLQSYKEEEEEDQNGVVTSEDSEVEWTCSVDFSDEGSFSDEDSLIEIAIPTGHYVGYKQQYMQRSNVMDDEDNLIEIDISMGLIKCSRF